MRRSSAALLFLACACSDGASPDVAPSLVFRSDPARGDFGAIEVIGIDPAIVRALERREPDDTVWHHFAVYTGDAAPADAGTPAVAGSYSVADGRLRFIPAFPPMGGQPYYVRFDGAALASALGIDATAVQLDSVLTLPRDDAPATATVNRMHPGVDTVPENLLKLYIQFSNQMSTGFARTHLKLLDDAGNEVEDAFLNVPQELWDPERRRLTVLFDPGRIKRDLRPNEELGLPLRPGRTYTIVVDSTWKDARGRPMLSGFTKRITVVAADREIPRVTDWTITAPPVGTTHPLVIAFPEPLDYALLERVITVQRADGTTMTGAHGIGEDGRGWQFMPGETWADAEYRIVVGTELEDLAGNNLRKLFDVDRNAPATAGAAGETVSIPLRPRR